MGRSNSNIGKHFRQYRTNQKLFKHPVYKSEYWCPVNSGNPNSLPVFPCEKNEDNITMKSKMSIQRMQRGMIALVFSKKLQEAGLPQMTEARVFRIEEGRAVVTDKERNAIVQLLGPDLFEIRRNYLGRLEYKIKMCASRGETDENTCVGKGNQL